MGYAIYKNGVFAECFGNIEFSPTVYQSAESLSDEQRAAFDVFTVVEERGVLADGNQWENRWTYRLENGCVVRTWYQEPIPQWAKDKIVAEKIDKLWAAADAYQSGFISGVAIGLLTIGVLQQKPKALAIQAWTGKIWDEYYARKAAVTYDAEPNLDFSAFGPIPYTVPELRAEVGVG